MKILECHLRKQLGRKMRNVLTFFRELLFAKILIGLVSISEVSYFEDFYLIRLSSIQLLFTVEIQISNFYPLNLKRPRCLLPLANRTILAYVLDHLIFNCKLQEIYLVYSSCGEQIQVWLKFRHLV